MCDFWLYSRCHLMKRATFNCLSLSIYKCRSHCCIAIHFQSIFYTYNALVAISQSDISSRLLLHFVFSLFRRSNCETGFSQQTNTDSLLKFHLIDCERCQQRNSVINKQWTETIKYVLFSLIIVFERSIWNLIQEATECTQISRFFFFFQQKQREREGKRRKESNKKN